MSDYDDKYEAVKEAHNAFTQTLTELDGVVAEEAVIFRGATRNALSVLRGIPRLLESAKDEQSRNDDVAAAQANVTAQANAPLPPVNPALPSSVPAAPMLPNAPLPAQPPVVAPAVAKVPAAEGLTTPVAAMPEAK